MKKTVFITGATSGIGKACAIKFAQSNYRVIISGRRSNLLNELSRELTSEFNAEVLALPFDVRIRTEVEAAIQSLTPDWKNIDVLVNNAGLAAGLNPIDEGSFDDWESMIDTNLKGMLYVTKYILPLMIQNHAGHIINIGSIAGRDVYPNGNVYCASKFAVDGLSKGMRMDLLRHDIKVTQVLPGAVETEFSLVRFKQDTERVKNTYNGYKPLTGDDVAEVVYFAANVPSHVNINDVTVVPANQASTTLIHRKNS